MRWFIGYWVNNTYRGKYVIAENELQAIKKARVKNIYELFPVDENNNRIG